MKKMINTESLRKLHEAATAGEWEVAPKLKPYEIIGEDAALLYIHGLPTSIQMASVGTSRGQVAAIPMDESSMENAAFIAAAHNNWIEMCDELDAARAEAILRNDALSQTHYKLHWSEKDNTRLTAENASLREWLQRMDCVDFERGDRVFLQGQYMDKEQYTKLRKLAWGEEK